jgi:sulfur-oxidizing protein SoxX
MPRAGSAPSPPRPSVDAVRAVLAAVLVLAAPAALVQQVWAQQIVGDAIPASLTGQPGDAARGRAIVANRGLGLCLLCHSGPIAEERFQGDLAPTLAGAGSRWSEGQLRLRIADGARLNADTIMPPYYRTTGLQRVARNFEGKTILSAAQVEDVVAYLATLKD